MQNIKKSFISHGSLFTHRKPRISHAYAQIVMLDWFSCFLKGISGIENGHTDGKIYLWGAERKMRYSINILAWLLVIKSIKCTFSRERESMLMHTYVMRNCKISLKEKLSFGFARS
jgi:hypothetical protein